MNTAALHRLVRLTARTSAALFTTAQLTQALRPPPSRAWRPLYLAFAAAHVIHFVAVSRFAVRTQGRDLFPGGRSMHDVGGWPAVFGIYTFFLSLVATGWVGKVQPANAHAGLRHAGNGASALIAAMFASFYLRQVPRSRWYALPAGTIAAAVVANIATGTSISSRSGRTSV